MSKEIPPTGYAEPLKDELGALSKYGEYPPEDIIKAALKVGRWFKERNIRDWKPAGIQSRQD